MKMRRYRHALVAMVMWTVCGFVCAGPVIGGETKLPEVIHIATPEWKDQTNRDGTGLFFDILRRIYEPAGIGLTITFVPWKRARAMVSANQADAMLSVWRKHALEKGQLLPAHPLYVEYTAVVFKKERIENFQGIQSLGGKRAVWLRGYDYHLFDQFSGITFAERYEVDRYEEAWQQLDRNRSDVYIEALIDLDRFIGDNAIDMSPYQKEILWGEDAFVAFSPSKKSEQLIAIFDARISKLRQSGELKKLFGKWRVAFFPKPR